MLDVADIAEADRGAPGAAYGRTSIGVTGAVAVGKSTFAGELAGGAGGLAAAPWSRWSCTDGFLHRQRRR